VEKYTNLRSDTNLTNQHENVLADSHSILNWCKNYFCHRFSDVKQIKLHNVQALERELSAFEVKFFTGKFKR
jgi:glucose dehydrogenase